MCLVSYVTPPVRNAEKLQKVQRIIKIINAIESVESLEINLISPERSVLVGLTGWRVLFKENVAVLVFMGAQITRHFS